jgi:hypothetical protein
MIRMPLSWVRVAALAVALLAPTAFAQQSEEKKETPAKVDTSAVVKSPAFDPGWLKGLKWRSIGPAAMGGRVVDLMINPGDCCNYYVVTATGGIFKTINNGTTFEPLFQQESTISIGDACLSPSSPDILWVGIHRLRRSAGAPVGHQ